MAELSNHCSLELLWSTGVGISQQEFKLVIISWKRPDNQPQHHVLMYITLYIKMYHLILYI